MKSSGTAQPRRFGSRPTSSETSTETSTTDSPTASPPAPPAKPNWVNPWLKWLGTRKPNRLTGAQYNLEVLIHLPGSRANTANIRNAINEYHRVRGEVEPFAGYPYPLATKYVPMSFGEVWDYARTLEPAPKAWLMLAALTRQPLEVVTAYRHDGQNPIRLGGFAYPVTTEVEVALAAGRPGTVAEARAALPPGVSLLDVQMALTAELSARGVPELTTAGLYGRWSAMKAKVAREQVGWFGVTGGPFQARGP